MMKLDVLILKMVHIDLFLLKIIDIHFRELEKNRQRFQSSWYKIFNWLEYSPTKDAAYCLLCYLFGKKPIGRPGANAFTIKGFRNWKKVNDGINCAFLVHMGKDLCSPHNNAVKCCELWWINLSILKMWLISKLQNKNWTIDCDWRL
jgi:hypothetical protein